MHKWPLSSCLLLIVSFVFGQNIYAQHKANHHHHTANHQHEETEKDKQKHQHFTQIIDNKYKLEAVYLYNIIKHRVTWPNDTIVFGILGNTDNLEEILYEVFTRKNIQQKPTKIISGKSLHALLEVHMDVLIIGKQVPKKEWEAIKSAAESRKILVVSDNERHASFSDILFYEQNNRLRFYLNKRYLTKKGIKLIERTAKTDVE